MDATFLAYDAAYTAWEAASAASFAAMRASDSHKRACPVCNDVPRAVPGQTAPRFPKPCADGAALRAEWNRLGKEASDLSAEFFRVRDAWRASF